MGDRSEVVKADPHAGSKAPEPTAYAAGASDRLLRTGRFTQGVNLHVSRSEAARATRRWPLVTVVFRLFRHECRAPES
jgi:hypothetical protein